MVGKVIVQQCAILMLTKAQKETDKKHLYVALNHPCEDKINKKKDMILMVNITSVKQDRPILDPTCVLDAGCHEFIIQQSYVLYREAQICDALEIKRNVECSNFKLYSNVSDEIYRSVMDGFFSSRGIKPKFMYFLKDAIKQGACSGICLDKDSIIFDNSKFLSENSQLQM